MIDLTGVLRNYVTRIVRIFGTNGTAMQSMATAKFNASLLMKNLRMFSNMKHQDRKHGC